MLDDTGARWQEACATAVSQRELAGHVRSQTSLAGGGSFEMLEGPSFRPGDWVIYRKHKHSASPGPRAKDVAPEPLGEEYSYCVDKFWMVTAVEKYGIVLTTRRGKRHVVDADDPNLRPARWWERILFRDRFPASESVSYPARSA